MSYYSILRKSAKWTKKAVLCFFNVALFNSFLVQRKINDNKMTYTKFLLVVAVALIEGHEVQCLGAKETECNRKNKTSTEI